MIISSTLPLGSLLPTFGVIKNNIESFNVHKTKYFNFVLSGHDNSLAKNIEHQKMGTEFDFTLGHYVEMCTKLGIFIDFDGTLSPLARTPELAFIPPETKKVFQLHRFSTNINI